VLIKATSFGRDCNPNLLQIIKSFEIRQGNFSTNVCWEQECQHISAFWCMLFEEQAPLGCALALQANAGLAPALLHTRAVCSPHEDEDPCCSTATFPWFSKPYTLLPLSSWFIRPADVTWIKLHDTAPRVGLSLPSRALIWFCFSLRLCACEWISILHERTSIG